MAKEDPAAEGVENDLDSAIAELESKIEQVEKDGFANAKDVIVDNGVTQEFAPWPQLWRQGEMAYDCDPPDSPFGPPDEIIMGSDRVASAAAAVVDYQFAPEIEEETPTGGSAPPRPTLEQFAEARDQDEEAYRDLVQPVSIVPESAYRGMMGRRVTVDPKKDPQEAVRWVGRTTEALPVSLAISPVMAPILYATASAPRAYASIQFGTRGGTNTVEIDIGTGFQVTLPCSVIYVSIGVDAGAVISPFDMSASLGFYQIVRSTPLIRTSYIDSLAASGTIQKVRPRFAAQLSFDRVDNSAQYEIDFQNGPTVLYSVIIPAGARLQAPVTLSNDVTQVTVTNQGMNTDNSRIMWGLAI